MYQLVKGLVEERGEILREATKISERAEAERRELSADEQRQFDDLMARAEAKARQVQMAESSERNGNLPGRNDFNGDSRSFLNQRDLKGYSLLRALQGKLENRFDGLEREVSDEIARRTGKPAQGFYFPTEIALSGMERRDLNLTTGAGAKPTITDPSNFIELLRNRTVVNQLGATILTGLTGDLSLPRQTAATSAYWVTEGSAPTESNATIGQIALAPKTLGAFTDLSRKFIIQSSVSAERFVREDLARVLGVELDRACLNGSGTGAEPQGILQASGVATVSLGSPNGGAPTWAGMVEMETALATSNADLGALAYVTTSQARGKLKNVERVATTGRFIWDDDNTINGYRAYATNLLPSNLTEGGSGATLSAMIFGNWNDLLIAFWTGLDILIDPYTASTTGTVRIVALQDVDIKLRHAESFAKIVDMITV